MALIYVGMALPCGRHGVGETPWLYAGKRAEIRPIAVATARLAGCETRSRKEGELC